MPSIRQSIRSSTASKRPTSAIADGQIALNTASGTPGLFFKDNANNIIKAGPAHYGTSAPNSSPAVGGSTGNSIGEAWLDSSLTPAGWKIWNGSAWVNATPLSSDTVQGLVELATNAETQAGADAARAVTSAGLQSKVSDSISTASSSGIASSSAVKTAYDLANAALPKSGGIITGNLEIGSTGSFTFEGSSADGFETTLAVVDPTADRTITFPNVTGTVVTTGDSGTVTGTMIADNTIVNAEVSPTAAIAFSKLASLASANIIVGNASGVPTATAVTGDVTITNSGVTAIASNVIVNADINSAAAIAYSKLALSSGITNTDVGASAAIVYSKLALSSGITNTDINASAAIAGTKISPNFGSQNIVTNGNITAANYIAASGTAAAPSITFTGDPNTGIYSPGADQVAISTGGNGRITVDASGNVNIDSNTLYVDAVNNRTGMGTSSPNSSYKLDVAGAILSSSSLSEIAIANRATNAAAWAFYSQSGEFNIYQWSAITSRLVIDTSGKVGIGTTAPQAQLQVLDQIKISDSTQAQGSLQLGDGASTSFNVGLARWNGSTNAPGAAGLGYFSQGTGNSGGHYFYTGDAVAGSQTIRATIDPSGRLLVGVIASPAHQLQVATDSAGKPSTNTWTIVSDERIKEDIELADLSLCYQAVKDIPLKRYKWKDTVYTEEQVHDRHKLGWISQDVKAVFPKAVRISEFKYNQVFSETVTPVVDEELDEDGNVVIPAQPERIERELVSEDIIEDCHDLNADQLYAAMYGAVQMLMIKVEALEASNADLLARLSALEGA